MVTVKQTSAILPWDNAPFWIGVEPLAESPETGRRSRTFLPRDCQWRIGELAEELEHVG